MDDGHIAFQQYVFSATSGYSSSKYALNVPLCTSVYLIRHRFAQYQAEHQKLPIPALALLLVDKQSMEPRLVVHDQSWRCLATVTGIPLIAPCMVLSRVTAPRYNMADLWQLDPFLLSHFTTTSLKSQVPRSYFTWLSVGYTKRSAPIGIYLTVHLIYRRSTSPSNVASVSAAYHPL